jgi:hypothetical protein
MKIVIAVLSDIHLDSSAHPVLSREDAIASAIASSEVNPGGIVLVLNGDIANTGSEAEYSLVHVFVSGLTRSLGVRFPGVPVHLLSVPGNHDLYHPPGSEEFRKVLVAGGARAMRQPKRDFFYIEQLLEPQKQYWDFAEKEHTIQPIGGWPYSRVCASVTLHFPPFTMRFNLLNTSILSQLVELQGALLLPLPLFSELLPANTSPEVTITVMHHPTFWIESATLTELRDILGRSSDYVLTGHEHFSSGYQVKSDLGHNLKYYESPALFDQAKALSSAFRVLVFDLAKKRERHLLFDWTEKQYSSKSRLQADSEWQDLVMERASRQRLAINAVTMNRLNDPGFAAPILGSLSFGLKDVFEYPDLKLRRDVRSKEVTIKRSGAVFNFLTEGGIRLVQGAPLSGKTSLTKALMLDIQAQGIATPLRIEGSALECASLDEFEKAVAEAFKDQFSGEQAEPYNLLPPERRCIIIDDWHLAAVPTAVRYEIQEWLTHFAKSSVLTVDQTYQVRELLSIRAAAGALAEQVQKQITQADISGLSRVSQARLIHSWLRAMRPRAAELPEESREARRLEILVSEMLGKDRLPAFPFFILCILHALETRKTDAIAGGSLGPLYELLIFTAVAKNRPDDPDIPKKLVFLQEIAFFMWSKRMDVISANDIDRVMGKFIETNYSTLPTSDFLRDLVAQKILSVADSSYTFSYAQYRFYFVARYIRAHIDEPGSVALQSAVDNMIDEISSPENAAIVTFLIYFEKEKNRIIDRLLKNAAVIYGRLSPARLEEDASGFSASLPPRPPLSLDEEPDVAGNRDAIRAYGDRQDEIALAKGESEAEVSKLSAYSYRDDLPDACKLHLVSQTIRAMGQIIRNFSVDLPGPRKVEVLKHTYLLALRALARVMEVSKEVISRVRSLEGATPQGMSLIELKRAVEDLFVLLPQLYALAMCSSVSESVGVMDMDRVYSETVEDLGPTVAIRMIDLTVQMNHFRSFPEREIRDLHGAVKGEPFSETILEWLVLSYVMLNPLDEGTRRRVARILGIKPRALPAPKI